MASQTFTLQLDGEVSLSRFVTAIDAWRQAIEEIISVVGTDQVLSALVNDLSGGSAHIEALLEFESESPALRFVQEYDQFAISVREPNIIQFPSPIELAAREMRRAAGMDSGRGMVIGSETDDVYIDPNLYQEFEDTIKSNASEHPKPASVEAIGTVTGVLQSLNSRKGLKAIVYDTIFDKGVKVTLTQSMHDTLGGLWDKPVIVTGLVRRNSDDGHPLSVKEVASIQEHNLQSGKEGWKRARGTLRGIFPNESSEDLIRRLRNA